MSRRPAKNVDIALWRNLPASLQQQEVYLHQASMEPNLWQPRVPFTAYEKMIFAGRRLNLHLILLFRALVLGPERQPFKAPRMPGRRRRRLLLLLQRPLQSPPQAPRKPTLPLLTCPCPCVLPCQDRLNDLRTDKKSIPEMRVSP